MKCRHISTTFQHFMDLLLDIRNAGEHKVCIFQEFYAVFRIQAGKKGLRNKSKLKKLPLLKAGCSLLRNAKASSVAQNRLWRLEEFIYYNF